jgi:hypothetical protein
MYALINLDIGVVTQLIAPEIGLLDRGPTF